jgi:hypothetical protein
MAETKKKKEVVKKENTTTPSSKQNAPATGEKKKKSKTIWYIVGGIVLLLIIIPIVAFFVLRGLFKKGVDTLEESVDQYEQVVEEEDADTTTDEDEDSYLYKKPTEETVDGDLEDSQKINSRFPDDLPLSGGIVTASSYSSDSSTDVELDVNSTVEEVLDWYESAFEELDWVITERSSSEDVENWISGEVSAETEDGERRIRVRAETNPYQDFTSVSISEYFY